MFAIISSTISAFQGGETLEVGRREEKIEKMLSLV